MIISKRAAIEVFVGGLLYACGYPLLGSSFYFFGAPIIGFYLYFKNINRLNSMTKSIVQNLIFVSASSLLAYYWVPEAIESFWRIDRSTSITLSFLSVYHFPHLFIYGIVISLISKYLPAHIVARKSHGVRNILYAALFIITQDMTPQLFNGYAGHSWIQLAPYLLPAQFFGEYIYSFIMALIALELNTYITYKKPNKINLSSSYFL